MSNVRLNLLARDIGDRLLAESRHQVLAQDVPMVLLRRGLYIGNTVACHWFADVSNVTRKMSAASLRDIAPRFRSAARAVSCRRAQFRAPASESPTPFLLKKTPLPSVVFVEPFERHPFLSLALRGLACPDFTGCGERNHVVRHFLDERAQRAGSNRTYLPTFTWGSRSDRGMLLERVCSYTQLLLTFSSAATSSTVNSSWISSWLAASRPTHNFNMGRFSRGRFKCAQSPAVLRTFWPSAREFSPPVLRQNSIGAAFWHRKLFLRGLMETGPLLGSSRRTRSTCSLFAFASCRKLAAQIVD